MRRVHADDQKQIYPSTLRRLLALLGLLAGLLPHGLLIDLSRRRSSLALLLARLYANDRVGLAALDLLLGLCPGRGVTFDLEPKEKTPRLAQFARLTPPWL